MYDVVCVCSLSRHFGFFCRKFNINTFNVNPNIIVTVLFIYFHLKVDGEFEFLAAPFTFRS